VSFASITLCVASHPVFVVYFVIDSVRKLLDTPSCPLGCVERQVYEMGPTQPLLQWIPGALSLGISGRGVKLTTYLHLVPRSRMHVAIPPLRNTSSWRGAQLKLRDFTFVTSFSSVEILSKTNRLTHSEEQNPSWKLHSLS